MKRALQFLSIVLLLTACGDDKEAGKEPENVPQETANEQGSHTVDLTPYDMPLAVELDRNSLVNDTAAVRWNEEMGKLEVTAGEHFHITISEEPADIPRLKADLERDMLRKHTVIDENPSLVIYRSTFPDEDIVFVHFYKVIEQEGRTFVIESHDQGRFNESDVRRMASAVVPAKRA